MSDLIRVQHSAWLKHERWSNQNTMVSHSYVTRLFPCVSFTCKFWGLLFRAVNCKYCINYRSRLRQTNYHVGFTCSANRIVPFTTLVSCWPWSIPARYNVHVNHFGVGVAESALFFHKPEVSPHSRSLNVVRIQNFFQPQIHWGGCLTFVKESWLERANSRWFHYVKIILASMAGRAVSREYTVDSLDFML